MTSKTSNRREFIQKTGSAALAVGALGMTAKSYGQVHGANNKVRVAVAGLKRRGRPLIESLSKIPNVEVTWVVEVDSRQMEKGLGEAEKALGYRPKSAVDLREVVQKKDVDAVFHATPDHWHAYGALITLASGKHAYVEKPASYNLEEDQILIRAEQAYPELKMQIGVQQRSAPASREIIGEIHNGVIGNAYKAVTFYNNHRKAVPVPKVVPVPDFLNWEIWQGPAPRREFLDILEDYNWHWRWHWGTAESANNGTHELDIARWALGVKFPDWVHAQSGKFHFPDDGWEMYDTMDVSFGFSGNKIIQWDGKSRNGYETYGSGRGTIIYGTEGSVFVDRGGYRLFDRRGDLVRERNDDGNEGGIALGGGGDMTTLHVKNFIDAIRGEAELNAPASVGAVSTHLTHYANVSSRTGDSMLMIDETTGQFKDWAVMDAFWGRDEYAPGWEVKI